MSNDMKWVKQQIQAAKVKKPVGNVVLSLVEHFNEISDLLSEEDIKKVVEVFSNVAQGHAIIKEKKEEVWVPLRPGNITVSDVVRVRADAFNGSAGQLHNGRVGVVVAVRYGDVIFKSTDQKEPALDGTHYPPQALEKLVVY